MIVKKGKELFEFVSRYQFPINGFDVNSQKEFVVGTCVLIRIEKRVFLITAAHVMNERHHVRDKELWIWNYSDGSKIVISEDIVGNHSENVPDWHDVAIVELKIEEYVTFNNDEFYEKCFLPLNRIISKLDYCAAEDEKLCCLVAGYPSSKNKILSCSYKKPKQFLFVTRLITDEKNHDSAEARMTTISVEWDNDNLAKKGANLPHPQGISGGGVWLLSDKSKFNPMLYAIPVAHKEKEKKVIAVKMCLVLSMLKDFYPGTLLDKVTLSIEAIGGDDESSTYIYTGAEPTFL